MNIVNALDTQFGYVALLCSRNSSYWEFSHDFYLFVALGFVIMGGEYGKGEKAVAQEKRKWTIALRSIE